METTRDYHNLAKHALANGAPDTALDFLDQPWRLGLEMTTAEARENGKLEAVARNFDEANHKARM
jgi:hypothetical protein